MDKESLKQALLEILQVDTEKGKTWFFPSNVSDKYTLLLGLTIKQTANAVAIALSALGVTVLLFRSTKLIPMLIYIIVTMLAFFSVWAFFTIKPIPDRPNISISEHRNAKKKYQQKKKIIYKKPNKRIDI